METCAGAADSGSGNRAHSWLTLAAAPARAPHRLQEVSGLMDGVQRHNELRVDGTEHYTRRNVVRLCRCLPNWSTISPTAQLICSATGPILQCPLSRRGSIRSGTATAAWWACLDAGSLPTRSIEIRPEARPRPPKPLQWPKQWRSVLCLRSRPPCLACFSPAIIVRTRTGMSIATGWTVRERSG
jgi:hypothetical protein